MANRLEGSAGYFYAGNEFLTREEMTVNARYIWTYLAARGWSLEAVAGMLGNMETESTINPAIWQNLTAAESNGYGLVQWTPSTKYTDWCDSSGLAPSHMDSALQRIEYEVDNGLQWIATDAYPLTFEEFKNSDESASYLANAFLYNYERPAETPQPARSEQATAWYEVLTDSNIGDLGGNPSGSGQSNKRKNMPLWLLVTASRRR